MGRNTERIEAGLLGSNIIEHLKRRQQAEECESSFWRRHPLWKHIENHIMGWDKGFKGKCYILSNYAKHGKPVCWSSNTGISLKAVELHERGNETPYLSFQLSIIYFQDEEQERYAAYGDEAATITLTERVAVPCDLALNFTEQKWKDWVNEKKEEREKDVREKQKEKLKKLLKETPQDIVDDLLPKKSRSG